MIYDSCLAASDLKDFSYNCQRLVILHRDLVAIRQEIDYHNVSGGIVQVSRDRNVSYHEGSDRKLLELLEKEEYVKIEYAALRHHLRRASAALAALNLTEQQIRLLILFYEKERSYERIGEALNCSALTVWKMLNEIHYNYANIQNRNPEIRRRSQRRK